jgi:hypothetical protein
LETPVRVECDLRGQAYGRLLRRGSVRVTKPTQALYCREHGLRGMHSRSCGSGYISQGPHGLPAPIIKSPH